MKLVFEGESLLEIYVQMQGALCLLDRLSTKPVDTPPEPITVGELVDLPETVVSEVQGPAQGPTGPGPRKPSVSAKHKPTPKAKPKPKPKAKAAAKPVPQVSRDPAPAEEPVTLGEVEWNADPLAQANEAAVDALSPAEMATLRVRTIEDLQAAYSGGHQKQVFELLAKYGNGAKSFRELQNDAFLPIRKAIDGGALA